MKYLKLFENFNKTNILTASQEEVISKESFDYLCACLNYVARSCAGETEHLKSRAPIDELINAILRYGEIVKIKVDKYGQLSDFQESLESSYSYLMAIDKYVKFTQDEDDYNPSNLEKPTGELKNIFENGLYLIEKIYNEFKLKWAGKLGEAPSDEESGHQINRTTPRWK